MKRLLIIVLLLSAVSCGQKDPAPGGEPVRIIFDTDLGNDIDDVLALQMLLNYEKEGRAELLGITCLLYTSYLRIKNLEIGYTLPKRWTDAIRANSIRVFFSVQNLATFTAYTGYDVEAWDNTNPYPGSRSFIGGVSVNF